MLFLSCPVEAQDSPVPLFDLHTAGGILASAPLKQVREDWSVSLSGSKAIEVKGTEVVALRRTKTALPPTPREEHVVFTNGDRLPGTPLQLAGERVRFAIRIGTDQELSLPLSTISVLWFAAPDEAEDTDLLRGRLASERRKHDTLLLRNGDMVEGTLTALSQEMVHFETADGKEVKVTREKIAALALSTELARSLRPKGTYGRLVLANGGRLSVLSVRADGQVLTGKTAFGAAVQVPVKQIVALDLRQGCAVYLSDLKPHRYEHTPYLGVRWPYMLDASVAGRDLRLGGSTYDKGIGMHSQSRLTFSVGAGYQWFEALVGLDEKTGRGGSVLIQVLVDGKPQEVGEGKQLTGRDAPLPIRVRVAGARELTLAVLFGRHGDVQDHVDWADARLIK